MLPYYAAAIIYLKGVQTFLRLADKRWLTKTRSPTVIHHSSGVNKSTKLSRKRGRESEKPLRR